MRLTTRHTKNSTLEYILYVYIANSNLRNISIQHIRKSQTKGAYIIVVNVQLKTCLSVILLTGGNMLPRNS